MSIDHQTGNEPGHDTLMLRAERTILASELSYRRLFEAAKDGILILDAHTGCITDVNPFLTNLLGFSHNEMLGKTVAELSPFKDIGSNREMLKCLQEGGYVRYEDLPLETREGRRIAVEFISNVYQAGDNQVIQCNIRDITERKRAEASLTASEERYRSLFTNMPDGLAVCRVIFEGDRAEDCIYLEVNEAFYGLTGLSNVVGRKITEVLPGIRKSNPEVLEIYGRVALGGEPERFEVYIDQLKASLTISAYSITPGCFVAVFENITERRRDDETLRLLNSAIEQAKESIMITDASLDSPGPRILFVNPAFTRMTGYTAKEIIGKSPRVLQGPRTDKAVLQRLRHSLTTGEEFVGEAVNYRSDGTEYTVEWQIAPIRNSSGTITHFVSNQRDVTERRRLEQEVRHSQKMEAIGRLASGVAHDFNNILAAILGNAELGIADTAESHPARVYLEGIISAGARAKALVQQILTFGRQQTHERRVIALGPLIEEAASLLRVTFPASVELVITLDASAPLVLADATQVHQILVNLATNAWHALDDHPGRIEVRLQSVTLNAESAAQLGGLGSGRLG